MKDKKEELKIVDLYVDGACSGNPGAGGYAAILLWVSPSNKIHKKRITGYEKSTTNNRMEITAVIEGVRALNQPVYLKIFSDSSYVVKSFTHKWIEKWEKENWNNRVNSDLWKELLSVIRKGSHKIEWIWVKGHDGNKYNEEADFLAVKAYKDEISTKALNSKSL